MSTEKAVEEDAPEPGDDNAELDNAIDELRGVLRKDAGRGERGDSGIASDGFDDMSISSASALADFGDDESGPATGSRAGDADRRFDLIMDIPIEVEIVLGASRMPVSALMNLREGSTIALDRKIGEPVEITVNGRTIGRGEITVLEDDDSRFGVRLIEIKTDKG